MVVTPGQTVSAGDVLMVIESMKMEFNLIASANATVHDVLCQQGAAVVAGQTVLVLTEGPPSPSPAA